MAYQPCPTCEKPGDLLAASSNNVTVEYYRCDSCGTVWTYDRRNPDAKPKIVLPPRDER
jgi:hypothetical protein